VASGDCSPKLRGKEEDMAQEAQQFLEMLKKFGSDLGLPKIDVDKLVDVQRKNIDAIVQAAKITAEGGKSVALKQKELAEAAFRETLKQVKEFKPSGTPQEILAKQTELARKAFDAAIENTREVAELVTKSNTEAMKIIGERMKGSVAEIRASFEQSRGGKS
jgi:phasin family protein